MNNVCQYCRAYYDARRVYGWNSSYCAPSCERAHSRMKADAFDRWWSRSAAFNMSNDTSYMERL
jgi:hypothetical protein